MQKYTQVLHHKFGIGFVWAINGHRIDVKFVCDTLCDFSSLNSVIDMLKQASTTHCIIDNLQIMRSQWLLDAIANKSPQPTTK